jgi:uncharacterized protein (TIGR00269 family)
MSCCSEPEIYAGLCKKHLLEHFVETVRKTIADYSMIPPGAKIMVATSGGKDSLALLDVLSELGFKVDALAIDEGIEGYRPSSLADLRRFCSERGISLKTVSFKDEYGSELTEMVEKNDVVPCRVCGVYRRQLLNKYSSGYDMLATGHNMDDELQSIMMNFWRGNVELAARLGPVTGLSDREGFVQRVKPFYFIPEKMVKIYTLLRGIDVKFVECPFAHDSSRHKIGEVLNRLESDAPGTKRKMMDAYIKMLPDMKKEARSGLSVCPNCGQPSSKGLCRACSFSATLVHG